MKLFPSPAQPSYAFMKNLLILCGLWFLFGFIGSPLSFLFGRTFVEGVIFSGFAGHVSLRLLATLPEFLVAAFLGAAVPHFVSTPNPRPWGFGFAIYLGLYHCMSWARLLAVSYEDGLVEVAIAVLVGAAAFSGFALRQRSLVVSATSVSPRRAPS